MDIWKTGTEAHSPPAAGRRAMLKAFLDTGLWLARRSRSKLFVSILAPHATVLYLNLPRTATSRAMANMQTPHNAPVPSFNLHRDYKTTVLKQQQRRAESPRSRPYKISTGSTVSCHDGRFLTGQRLRTTKTVQTRRSSVLYSTQTGLS